VIDTVLRDNNYGLGIYNSSGSVKASIDRVHSDSNGKGFEISPLSGGTVFASITNSVASNNSTGFANWESGGSAKGVMNLEYCIATNNSYVGVYSSNNNSSSETRLSNCTITGNLTGILKAASGTIYTRQNNTIHGNTTNISGALTPFSAQ
jgi:hypothetical protein